MNKLIIALFSVYHISAFAAGFVAGSEFRAHYLTGNLAVLCTEGGRTDTTTTRCEYSYLSPDSFSEFSVNSDVDADSVRLLYRNARGKLKKKDSEFDPSTGKSTKKFNLWHNTLFQAPILRSGSNDIIYELSKGRDVIGKGTFTVEVLDMYPRSCPNDRLHSNKLSDCRDTVIICRQYFRKHNYCQ
jgi:hypothetical protein